MHFSFTNAKRRWKKKGRTVVGVEGTQKNRKRGTPTNEMKMATTLHSSTLSIH